MCVRLTRTLCGRRMTPTVIDFAAKSRAVQTKESPKPRGRFQWWKEPVYCAPHVHPLDRGVDFTFQDGRPLFVTSKREVERKLKQIELGEKVVKLLAEINEAESLYAKELDRHAKESAELKRLRPVAKGNKSIC
ncbi:unnamed protein product [Toxocara canis]|uniref:39S ribosomal protein L52, mitochondrial n=1 Tax=Toxocara canis TaxID=6265 RepID=A0A183V7U8_TOXCA|nr:unnamed protein product [Toxocara canis]